MSFELNLCYFCLKHLTNEFDWLCKTNAEENITYIEKIYKIFKFSHLLPPEDILENKLCLDCCDTIDDMCYFTENCIKSAFIYYKYKRKLSFSNGVQGELNIHLPSIDLDIYYQNPKKSKQKKSTLGTRRNINNEDNTKSINEKEHYPRALASIEDGLKKQSQFNADNLAQLHSKTISQNLQKVNTENTCVKEPCLQQAKQTFYDTNEEMSGIEENENQSNGNVLENKKDNLPQNPSHLSRSQLSLEKPDMDKKLQETQFTISNITIEPPLGFAEFDSKIDSFQNKTSNINDIHLMEVEEISNHTYDDILKMEELEHEGKQNVPNTNKESISNNSSISILTEDKSKINILYVENLVSTSLLEEEPETRDKDDILSTQTEITSNDTQEAKEIKNEETQNANVTEYKRDESTNLSTSTTIVSKSEEPDYQKMVPYLLLSINQMKTNSKNDKVGLHLKQHEKASTNIHENMLRIEENGNNNDESTNLINSDSAHDAQYTCDICNVGFNRNTKLESHKKNHDSKEKIDKEFVEEIVLSDQNYFGNEDVSESEDDDLIENNFQSVYKKFNKKTRQEQEIVKNGFVDRSEKYAGDSTIENVGTNTIRIPELQSHVQQTMDMDNSHFRKPNQILFPNPNLDKILNNACKIVPRIKELENKNLQNTADANKRSLGDNSSTTSTEETKKLQDNFKNLASTSKTKQQNKNRYEDDIHLKNIKISNDTHEGVSGYREIESQELKISANVSENKNNESKILSMTTPVEGKFEETGTAYNTRYTCDICNEVNHKSKLESHKKIHDSKETDEDDRGNKDKKIENAEVVKNKISDGIEKQISKNRDDSPIENVESNSGFPEIHQCDICKKVLSTRNNLSIHKLTHGARSYECNICNFKFTYKRYLQKHAAVHSEERPFSCKYCGKSFKYKNYLIVHEKIHTGDKSYVCQTCGVTFTHRAAWSKHIKRIHEDPESMDLRFACTKCDARFVDKYKLNRHQTVHIDKRNFKCDKCDNTFKTHEYLKKHQRVHSVQRKYDCHLCNKKYKDSLSLRRHILAHTGERKFECSECDHESSTKESLKLHLLSHSMELKYQCDLCPKKFTAKFYMNRHRRYHFKKPYACDTCEAKFTAKHNLTNHKRKHYMGLLNEKGEPVKKKNNNLKRKTKIVETELEIESDEMNCESEEKDSKDEKKNAKIEIASKVKKEKVFKCKTEEKTMNIITELEGEIKTKIQPIVKMESEKEINIRRSNRKRKKKEN